MRIRLLTLQLTAFGIIAVLGIVYATFNVIGVDLLHRPFHVALQLPDGGGIFPHANVDYRGQQIGSVSDVRLRPGGVTVELAIDPGRQVPAGSRAVITALSAIGEQYVDLRPGHPGPPFLHDGDVIPESRAATPVPVATLLVDLEQVVRSIDARDLDTVVDELATAFGGTGQQLHGLVSNAGDLVDALRAAEPETIDLIGSAQTVLRTAVDARADFHTFSTSLAQLTDRLRASDHDLQALIDNGTTALPELDRFVRENSAALSVLLGNLVAVGNITVARVPGLSELLVALPDSAAKLATLGRGGQFQATLGIDTRDPFCGYLSPGQARSPLDASARPPFVNKDCGTTAPDLLQRGARDAPRPAGDGTTPPPSGPAANAQGPTLTLADHPAGAGTATVYDPLTGVVGIPGGGTMRIGAQSGGSWLGLLLALLRR